MSAFQWLEGAEPDDETIVHESQVAAVAAPKPPSINFVEQELFSLLAQHKEWVESEGARGARLELSELNFEGKDLAGVNLRDAVLHHANFRRAELLLADMRGAHLVQSDFRESNLLGADFTGANLQGARFGASSGLATRKLGGANLLGAELPESLLDFDGVKIATVAYSKARRLLWVMMILAAVGSGVVLLASDEELLRNLPVPWMGGAIPMVGFFFAMPVVLVFVYLFFHLALHRLEERLAELPVMFPDGRPLEKAGPWEKLGLLGGQIQGPTDMHRPLSFLERLVSRLFSDWVVPIALLLFWARYLVLQDMRATLLHILLFGGSVAFAIYVKRRPRPARAADPGSSPLLRKVAQWLPGIDKAIGPLRIASIFALLLAILSVGVVFGAPHDRNRAPEFPSLSPRRWSADILWLFGYDPFAHLTESNISSRPKNWSGKDQDVPAVRGVHLNKSSLRYAQAYRSFWVNAHLWETDFQGALLSESDFRGANLREANLSSARLDRVALGSANLQSANLSNANLALADLHDADLSFATLSGAIMVETQLQSANLFSADLRKVELPHANLEHADLREAHLDGAQMAQADLQESYLWSAKLPGAGLQDARFQRAILIEADLERADLRGALFQAAVVRGADFRDADLDGADMRGAIGLLPDQVCAARSRRGLVLDDTVLPLVQSTCGIPQ
jgi:uncharacterized protein YjbI with pentapeptide repeats